MPYRDPTGNGPEVLFPGDTIHLSGLKEARLRAGLSRGELARKARVSLEDITAIEKTNSRVLVLTAIKIARALGVEVEALREESPSQPPAASRPAAESTAPPTSECASSQLPQTKTA
jgi:DNA-binding XRE family transcriptional regulator